MIDALRWFYILTYAGCANKTAGVWAPLFERWVQPERFNLGVRELDDFTGQALWESRMLTDLEEDLSYRPERLMAVWPGRFPSLEKAKRYAWAPQALAEYTYGGRYGNDRPGDGWKYRGRGIPMVTFRDNYLLLQKLTGLPLVDQPDLLLQPATALRCATFWWEDRIPDSAIDSISRVTRMVQGGQLDIEQRDRLTTLVGKALI